MGEGEHHLAALAEQAEERVAIALGTHFLQIVPGTKSAAAAENRHHANVGILLDRVQLALQGGKEFPVQGIEGIRPVQGQAGNALRILVRRGKK